MVSRSKLKNTEVLISTSLFDPNIIHDGFALINNTLKEYDEMNAIVI